MKISQETFIEEFKKKGLEDELGGEEGLKALQKYLEDAEKDWLIQTELDAISLCCDYTYYEYKACALYDYGFESLEELKNKTTIIEFGNDQLIVACF